MTGCEPSWRPVIILIIGAVTTTYTLLGGIRTVMITASIQGAMLLLGVLVVIGSLLAARGRSLAVIGACSAAGLAPLVALVSWLIVRSS